jgi:hypothetical protein
MLSATILEKLDIISKTLRNTEKPFGGIQLVFAGVLLLLFLVNGQRILKVFRL